MIKGSIFQKDITVLNVYLYSKRASTMRKILIETQEEIDEFTIIAGDSFCCCCFVTKSGPNLCAPMDCSTPVCPCPSLSSGVYVHLRFMSIELVMPSNHPILCCPFSSCPQSFPASGSFLVSWLFASDGQIIRVSASVLPMNIQGNFL